MIPAVCLNTRSRCDVCLEPASVKLNDGWFLCERCSTLRHDSISVTSVPHAPTDVATTGLPPAASVVATLSVIATGNSNSPSDVQGIAVVGRDSTSDGAALDSLPSGENKPSVTQAGAPSEPTSFDAELGFIISAHERVWGCLGVAGSPFLVGIDLGSGRDVSAKYDATSASFAASAIAPDPSSESAA